MRIASIFIPSFPLQAALASAAPPPSRATPIAVIASHGAPVVAACSRAAYAQGVRSGMVASVARSHAPELVCLVRDPAGEQELVRTLAEALLALTPSVDLGDVTTARELPKDLPRHHALFVEVPSGKRGAAFGAKVVDLAASLGLKVRVGIADDRFTAVVAASHGGHVPHGSSREGAAGAVEQDVIVVPRGGSAAFLAPLPLALLALPEEVQHVLEALGVRTLGAFAELPPPSVAVTREWDADLQALARGDGGARLEPFVPARRMRDRIAAGPSGLGLAIQRLAGRLAGRLTGRGATHASVELGLVAPVPAVVPGGGTAVPGLSLVPPAGAPVAAARTLELKAPFEADAIGDKLARAIGDAQPVAIELGIAVPADEAADAVPERVAPEASEPAPDVSPLVLTPVPAVLGHRPEHRRTRRGKQRPRIAPGQARLFSSRDG